MESCTDFLTEFHLKYDSEMNTRTLSSCYLQPNNLFFLNVISVKADFMSDTDLSHHKMMVLDGFVFARGFVFMCKLDTVHSLMLMLAQEHRPDKKSKKLPCGRALCFILSEQSG